MFKNPKFKVLGSQKVGLNELYCRGIQMFIYTFIVEYILSWGYSELFQFDIVRKAPRERRTRTVFGSKNAFISHLIDILFLAF